MRVRTAAPHHPDVAGRGRQRALHRRDVELWVVGENAHHIATAELGPALGEHWSGPSDPHLVCHREAATCREDLPRVTHQHPEPEDLRDSRQCRCEVDRAEDPHLRGRGPALHEHRHDVGVGEILRGGLPRRAVVTHTRSTRLELREGIATHHAIELGIAER